MAPVEIDTVDNRAMPDISIQHLVSLLLIDGDLTFDSSHDAERMQDSTVIALKQKITLVPDPSREPRRAHVTITTDGGRSFSHQAGPVHGSPENPMTREDVGHFLKPSAQLRQRIPRTREDVDRKAFGLLAPVLGEANAQQLIEVLWNIDTLENIRDLRTHLRLP
jgi:2-methylcitrate dehydratase PrpD